MAWDAVFVDPIRGRVTWAKSSRLMLEPCQLSPIGDENLTIFRKFLICKWSTIARWGILVAFYTSTS